MLAAIAAGALARAGEGAIAHYAAVASQLALLIWAYQEITSGANWFRRLLGVGGAGRSLAALKRLTSESVAG